MGGGEVGGRWGGDVFFFFLRSKDWDVSPEFRMNHAAFA